MKLANYLCIIALLFSVSFAAELDLPEPRLIKFGPLKEHEKWLSGEQLDHVIVDSDNFMDITDFPEPDLSRMADLPFSPIPQTLNRTAQVEVLQAALEQGEIVKTITKLSNLYTRYYSTDTGKQAAEILHAMFSDYAVARSDVSVQYFKNSFLQPSVIARIEGADPNKAGTVVVLGAHEDSVGSSKTGRSPGADDDASGSATVLEVFRVLVQSGYKPNRTVEFHTYAAEEAGLLGSQAIAQDYFNRGIIVESQLQLDMTMYGAQSPIGIITDFTNPDLNKFIRMLVTGYSNLKWNDSKCGYGCSDHASWTKYGYRASFPFETPFGAHNPYIHSTQDLLEKLSPEKGLEYAKFALGYIVEMAQ